MSRLISIFERYIKKEPKKKLILICKACPDCPLSSSGNKAGWSYNVDNIDFLTFKYFCIDFILLIQ